MAEDKLFNYYERQDVLPTFGNFKSAAELEAYAGLRRELFSDKLVLPPRLFRDADVLEFGPDSGENALVFAGWGANMTLAEPNRIEAALDGQVSVNGPIEHVDQLRGNVELTRLSVTAKGEPGQPRAVEITNQGTLTASLDRGVVQLQNVRLQGSGMDVQAQGTASITGGPLALSINGNVGLNILQSFDSDIYSAGSVTLAANIRGTTADPILNGQVVLKDATLTYASLPNGISKANGTILLSGKTANIQNLTAESGGGKLTLTGFAEYGEPMKVVATGGLANVFKDEIGMFDAIEPDLMSIGLLEIWRRNRG